MRMQSRLTARLTAAAVAAVLPASAAFVSQLAPTASTVRTSSEVDVAGGLASLPLVMPQVVEPTTIISGGLSLRTEADRNRTIKVAGSKGDRVFKASDLAGHDLPSAAMRAYKTAARTMNAEEPGCNLPWTLLAGIGRVESDHGRYGGSVLGADGVPRPAIVGIALDGAGPVAAIADSDSGRFDGDKVWDRAVGPMQFIPTTWAGAGRDGDRDGLSSPNDIDDAALAAAGYLCHDGHDLSTDAGARAAVFSYNHSDYYVNLVRAFANGYETGSFSIPSPPVESGAGDGVVPVQDDRAGSTSTKAEKATRPNKPKKPRRPKASGDTEVEPTKRGAKPGKPKPPNPVTPPEPTKPAKPPKPPKPPKPKPNPPKPTPSPTPTPEAPKLLTASGPVGKSGAGWQIGGVQLAVGDLAAIAAQDWDGDGTTEPLAAEFDGLAAAGTPAVLTYYAEPTFKVNGFSV